VPNQDVVSALEARFGMALTALVGGADGRTFAGDGLVFKVFAPQTPQTPAWQPAGIYAARLEALNMTKAGLTDWVVEALEIAQHGVLVTRRYPGQNFRPEHFSEAALLSLAQFFCRLHGIAELGVVSRSRLEARLEQFGGTLHDLPEARQLIGLLRGHLDEIAGTPQAFCHRDPHAANVLLKNPGVDGAVPAALLVDWLRASPDDPARDLAILTTGTLVLLGEREAVEALHFMVRCYPDGAAVWARLRFWVPLTYLHDMHWFRAKEPAGFRAAVKDKMPKALRFYHDFGPL